MFFLKQFKAACLVFSCVFLSLPNYASDSNRGGILFQRIGVEQGLSQAAAQAILQDRNGFIWIGTQHGLNRYDGYKFETFTHDINNPNSIANGWIYSLLEDNSGHIWIATDDGLDRFDPLEKTFIHYKYSPEDASSLPDNTVRALLQDSLGNVWVGTAAGLARLKQDMTFEHVSIPIESEQPLVIRSLAEGKGHVIWLGTQHHGLIAFNTKTGKAIQYKHSFNNQNTISGNYIRSIHIDKHNIAWIGTNGNGLSMLDVDSGKVIHHKTLKNKELIESASISKIFEDKNGNIWISTLGQGLYKWLDKSNSFLQYRHTPSNPYSLSDDTIYDILQDDGNVIWVGTYSGISKWNASTPIFPHILREKERQNTLSNNKVSAFAEQKDGKIWVSTIGGGLHLWEPKSNHFTNFRHNQDDPSSLSSDLIMSMSIDSQDNVWLGTMSAGLNRFSENKDSFSHFLHSPTDKNSLSSNAISNILEDSKGRLWISTFGGGLNLYLGDNRFRRFPSSDKEGKAFSSLFIIDLEESSDGKIWLATDDGGIMKFDPETENVEIFLHDPENPDSISDNHTFTVLETTQGVWVGTRDTGLNLYKDGSWKNLNPSKNLPSNAIYGILEDEYKRVWVSHANGLSMYDTRSEIFTNYTTTHGLQGEDFNSTSAYKTRSGKMLFGGANGFNYFDPLTIHGNRHMPPIKLTRFTKFNKEFQLNKPAYEVKSIDLDYSDYVVGFEFSALDFTAPEKNKYRYKLEGFDSGWVETQNIRQATYTNLKPGNYIFKVQGSNNDGVWNSEGASIDIAVAPPPWRTWWAYLLYAIAILLAFYVAANLYKERLQKEEQRKSNIKLKALVAERTKELEKEIVDHKAARSQLSESLEEKEVLLKEVHHRVKNNMQVISSLLNIQADSVADESFISLLNESQQRIKSMALIHENLYRSDNLLEINFESYIDMLANGLLRFYHFENLFVSLEINVDEIYLDIDRAVPCGLIINELISNALKHAWKGVSGSGLIRIEFNYIADKHEFRLSVSDDGIGVPDDFDIENTTSMGLEIVRILSQQLDGKLELQRGNGTQFVIEFPGV